MACRFAAFAAITLAPSSAEFLRAVAWHQHKDQQSSYDPSVWLTAHGEHDEHMQDSYDSPVWLSTQVEHEQETSHHLPAWLSEHDEHEQDASHDEHEQHASYDHPAWLHECRSIYLDVGANMGVQIRKLFEPEQYPGADIAKAFDRIYGPPVVRRANSAESGLCALGLEPNPEHAPRLRELERAYGERGWRFHLYPFAAWGEEGQLGFNMTGIRDNVEDGTNVDAHLNSQDDAVAGDADYVVRTIDLADFVSTLPRGAVRLMKMDIEGAEYETLSSMLHRGVLCSDRVAEAFIEVHPWGETTEWVSPLSGEPFAEVHPRSFGAVAQRLGELSASGRCGGPVTKFAELDDETYTTDVDSDFANFVSFGRGHVVRLP